MHSEYHDARRRVYASMRTKLQLQLLRKLRQPKGLAKGFTLIELMIVVGIVGILAAVGIPKFLDVKKNADAGAKAGEVVGLAKECAVYVAAGGVGTAPASGIPGDPAPCSISADNKFERTFTAGPIGIKCLTDTSAAADTKVTATAKTDGSIICAFS